MQRPGVRSQVAASFGARVREAREAHGWSLATLAGKLLEHGIKLNAAQVSKVELAQRATSIEELCAFSRALRVAPARLIDANDLSMTELRWMRVEAEGAKLLERVVQLDSEKSRIQDRLAHLTRERDNLIAQVREDRADG